MNQLKAVVALVREHEAEWIAALCNDVGKPAVEADIAEISSIYSAAGTIIDGLKSWMRPEPQGSFGLLFPASCEVMLRYSRQSVCRYFWFIESGLSDSLFL